MKTNNESGKSVSIFVGIWFLLKTVLNMIIDGLDIAQLPSDIGNLVTAAVVMALMVLGIKYTNYVVAVIMAIVVAINLIGNLSMLFDMHTIIKGLIYLAEGAIDVILAIVLCLSGNVKEHFSNSLSDLGSGN